MQLMCLKETGLEPMPLAAKEGLALLNGTQFMSSYAVWSPDKIKTTVCMGRCNWCTCLPKHFMAKDEPFKHPIHRVRPHKGQIATAQRILEPAARQRDTGNA